jgi:hypothetical protein
MRFAVVYPVEMSVGLQRILFTWLTVPGNELNQLRLKR